MKIVNNGVYSFNDIIIDAKNMSIIHKDETTALSYSDFLVFVYLVENSNQVAEKNTLMAEGWPGNIVTESSLHKSIYNLRYALRNTDCLEIKTIPSKGYFLSCDKAELIPIDNFKKSENKDNIPNKKFTQSFRKLGQRFSLFLSLLMIFSSFTLLYLTLSKSEKYQDERFEIVKIGSSEILKLKGNDLPDDFKEIIKPNHWYFYAYYNQTHQISVYDYSKNSTENYFIKDKDWKNITKKWSN